MYGEWNNNSDNETIYGYDHNTQGTRYPNSETNISEKKPEKKKGTMGKTILNGAVFGLVAALVFSSVMVIGRYTFLKEEKTVEASVNTPAVEEKKDMKVENTQTASKMITGNNGQASVTEIAKNCMPSIVSITNRSVSEVRSMFGTRQYESESCGSGIIIGQNDTELLIATNNHVVEAANTLSVCFGDSEDAVYEASIKGTDSSNDLAIVSVKLSDVDGEVLSSLKVATIGSSQDLQVGEQVIAIGNALGYGQSVTTGIVSALDREVSIDNMTAKLIQTDAAINPGNSGGALLNVNGELIGINSAKFASAQVEGMGYAIPIDTAEPILKELMMRETRQQLDLNDSGFLGINCQNVDASVSEAYGIPEGVYVLSVTDGGAAQKAGIQKGDIITKFDGITINTVDELKNTLLYYAANEQVDVVIQRANNGEYAQQTVSVVLDKNMTEPDSSQNNQKESSSLYDYGSGNENGNSFYYGDDAFRDFFNQFQ